MHFYVTINTLICLKLRVQEEIIDTKKPCKLLIYKALCFTAEREGTEPALLIC
jgi:hypothetical protein